MSRTWDMFKDRQKSILYAVLFLGVIFFSGYLLYDARRAWMAYLVGFFLVTSLSLVSLFFLSLSYLTSAAWSANIRRFFEAFAQVIPWLAPFGLIYLLGVDHVYNWLDPQVVAMDHYIHHKVPYLNRPFLIVRMFVFFAGWIFFSRKILNFSKVQDERVLTKQENTSLVRYSVGYMIFYVLSYSFFSVDLLMSLQPKWYSTIFGVYTFGGSMQAFFACVILFILWAKREGAAERVSADHLHDLGKYMFGFTVFWAYIAFSQYMLIWYANLPEETFFFIHRTQGPWLWASLALIVFKFVVPFFALLPRWAKREPFHLTVFSSLIVATQALDIYWLVYPHYSRESLVFGLLEVFVILGFIALFILASRRFLLQNPIRVEHELFNSKSDKHHVTF